MKVFTLVSWRFEEAPWWWPHSLAGQPKIRAYTGPLTKHLYLKPITALLGEQLLLSIKVKESQPCATRSLPAFTQRP